MARVIRVKAGRLGARVHFYAAVYFNGGEIGEMGIFKKVEKMLSRKYLDRVA